MQVRPGSLSGVLFYRFYLFFHVDSMVIDTQTKMSTHGPRSSRRAEWRKSKGLPAQPSRHGMNRQGGLAARRKAGRSKRRR